VVHRDIKPHNIFVKGASAVLGDFGLMKLLDGNAEADREIFEESVGQGQLSGGAGRRGALVFSMTAMIPRGNRHHQHRRSRKNSSHSTLAIAPR